MTSLLRSSPPCYHRKYRHWSTTKSGIESHRRRAFSHAFASTSSPPPPLLDNAEKKSTNATTLPPNFDFTALVASVANVSSKLPLKATHCAQPDPHTLRVNLISLENERVVLQCSSHPDFARVFAASSSSTKDGKTKKQDRLSFGVLANELLRDKILIDARVPIKFERVAVFRFAERVKGESEYELVCEVTGRKSNVIIVDSKTRNVVACSHQIGEKQSQVRSVVLGKPYAFPPAPPGKDPMEVGDWKEFRKTLIDDGEDDGNIGSLSKAFQGVSPALERTLRAIAADAAAAGEETETETDKYYEAFYNAFARWRSSIDNALEAVENVEEEEEEEEEGRAKDIKAYFSEHTRQILLHETENAVLLGDEENEDESNQTFSLGALFAEMYEDKSNENEYESERNDCLKAVKSALQKSANKKAAFEKQIKAGEKHDEMSLEADAIMAYASQYKKNDDFVSGFDFETGEPKMFKVDKDLGAIGTAEALYKKARKLRRTADAVLPLMEELEKEREYLEQVEFNLRELSLGEVANDAAADAADDENSSSSSSSSLEDKIVLEEIKIELVRANLMKPRDKQSANEAKAMNNAKKKNSNKNSNSKQSRKEQLMSGVRQYVAPSGKIVLCGRNSRGNEAVSLHLSQPQDVWFHVRGAPGSHVVLRQQPGAVASDEDMQFAADLAAFHSKLRNDGKVPVSYTSPKNVRKPSGVSRLGMVTITKEEVMVGRPDDSISFKNGETGRARGDINAEDEFD